MQGWRAGDKVMAFTTYGAFAEEVKTEASRLLPLPEKWTTSPARRSSSPTRPPTTRCATGAPLPPARRSSVSGGGVGLAAIEVGGARRARDRLCFERRQACGMPQPWRRRDDQLRDRGSARAHQGAYRGPRRRRRLRPGRRALPEPAFRSIAWRGRHLVIGFAAGDIPKLPLNLALLKGASVVGVFWGDFTRREPARFSESVRQLTKWYAEGRLKPHVSQTFPLEKAAEALKSMAARQVKGKVVLTVG